MQSNYFSVNLIQYSFTVSALLFVSPKVRHRWCELVIKHKYIAGYGDVEKFLKEDQVSTVY